MNIREQIKLEMYKQGVTFDSLALKSGVPRTTCCRFINSNNETGFNKVIAMADALGFELVLRSKK